MMMLSCLCFWILNKKMAGYKNIFIFPRYKYANNLKQTLKNMNSS